MKKRVWVLLLCLMISLTACGESTAAKEEASNETQPAKLAEANTKVLSEDEQWEIIADAYTFTFPLVIMDWTKKSVTNTDAPDLAGHAPLNQLIHAQNLATAKTKFVVTPNVDTVYTQAWLSLAEEPMVFIMPKTDRYYKTQVLDAWTNTPAVLESGSYLIAREGYGGEVPHGLEVVEVPTDMIWMLTRILVQGEEDMTNVSAIQRDMQLLPLSAYQSFEPYTPPNGEYKEENAVVPLKAALAMGTAAYFDRANELMAANPPFDADAEMLERLAKIGVGPGFIFDSSEILGNARKRWKDMKDSLAASFPGLAREYGAALGVWTYFDEPIGNYGSVYDYRTLTAYGGLGANPLSVALYAKAATDVNGIQLNGQNEYVLHFDTLPPIRRNGFWSITAYGEDDFLIRNEIDRYSVNDRSKFILNEDGTLDIILSLTRPENTDNWLPVCPDDYHLFMRIYTPDMDRIDGGWIAPTIEKNK